MKKHEENAEIPVRIDLPTVYAIRVRAILNQEMLDWLGSFQAIYLENEDSLLVCSLADQSALFGVLLRIYNMGIPIISFNPLPSVGGSSDQSTTSQENQS